MMCSTSSTDTNEEQDYITQTRLFLKEVKQRNGLAYEKIWAHRVNTKEKLQEAKQLFAGVEIDAVFDVQSRKFFLYHPPAENIGFELSELLRISGDKPDLKLWLDWKNPEIENFDYAFEELNRLDGLYRIKNRMIVETGSYAVFSDLKNLSEKGWMHSYYLPTEEIVACASSPSTRPCLELARNILNSAQTVGCRYLSFDYAGYPFVSTHRSVFPGYRLLSWNTDLSSTSIINLTEFLKTAEPFDAFLITFPSRFFH
jgi:hypothetical protein